MIPEAMTELEDLEKETDLGIQLIQSERGYVDAEAYVRRQKELDYVTKRNMVSYKMIMKQLASHGITQKQLESVASNISLEAFK